MFSGCTVSPDSKEIKHGSSDQEASPYLGKNTEVFLGCPYNYFQQCAYLRCPWVSFVTTDEFSMRVTKIKSRIGVS